MPYFENCDCDTVIHLLFQNDLIFYVNGESQGIAASNIPPRVFAVVDLYGKCAQVSIVDNSRDSKCQRL